MNGLPSAYKGAARFLITALLSICGSAYPFHFRNPTSSEMKGSVALKFISKINECILLYHVLNGMMKFFVYWIINSLKLHTNFADRLWNFKSMSQTATKLSDIGTRIVFFLFLLILFR